jgi:hypothetical protein
VFLKYEVTKNGERELVAWSRWIHYRSSRYSMLGEEKGKAIELWKWEREAFAEDVVRECENVGARVVNAGKVALTDY